METGVWHYLTSCGSLHLFKTEDENSVALETDALTTVRALHKTMMKTAVLPILLVVLLVAWFMAMQIDQLFTSPLYYFGGDDVNQGLAAMALLVLSAIAGLLFLIRYFFWYQKAKHKATEGIVIPFTPFPLLAISFGLLIICTVLLWSHRLVLEEDSYLYRTIFIVMGAVIALLSFVQYKVNHEKSSMRVVRRSFIMVIVGVACCAIALVVPVKKKGYNDAHRTGSPCQGGLWRSWFAAILFTSHCKYPV